MKASKDLLTAITMERIKKVDSILEPLINLTHEDLEEIYFRTREIHPALSATIMRVADLKSFDAANYFSEKSD